MNCRRVEYGSKNLFMAALSLCIGISFCIASTALADAPGPGVKYRAEKKAAPVAPPVAVEEQTPPAVVEPVATGCGCNWGARLAGGVPVWFFNDEGNLPGAGAYADFYENDCQINLRVGIEGRHMYLGQDEAASASEFSDKTTRITYMRIPLSVEYIVPLEGETTQLFLGGGPDIIHTANDIDSTDVGAHLSARLLHNFYESWGVAVEAGYMWGRAQRPGPDVKLDGAYIVPSLNYTF